MGHYNVWVCVILIGLLRLSILCASINLLTKIMFKKLLSCLFCLTCLTCNQIACATPYIPSSPEQVLERLPASTNASQTEFKNLTAQLSAHPNDIGLAVKLARLYIERSRAEGDPRYLGYAEAVLAPWWKLSNPPVDILVLRATLLQSTHQFDKSLADLDAVLKSDSANGQAWITRATILQVQGKYAAALKSCEQLYAIAPPLITTTCLSNIQSLSGKATQSYHALKAAYVQSSEIDPSIQVWILTLLAEMAARLGDDIAAEQYFQNAMKTEEPDGYLLGAYSDFLLDKKRPQEVVKLLKTKTRIDPLLLRYAEALKAINSTQTNVQTSALKHRFAAATMRGDTVHQREQSRFELRLRSNPKRALALAKLNWQIQKEPADARLYLEAAIAMHDKNEASTVINWLAANQQEDATLSRMISKYKSL